MATTIIALSGTLLTGQNSFGPLTPPAGTTLVQAAVDRTSMALLTQPIDLALELSIDEGATWRSWGGGTMAPGTLMTGASVLAESALTVPIPVANASTRLRGALTTREVAVTAVTIRYT